VHPGIVVVDVPVVKVVHAGGKPALFTGGPTVPVRRVFVPLRSPLLLPLLGIVTRLSEEQLTGTSLPRKTICGWAGSLLHSTMEAVAPGENPVPATVMTSPPARPLQTGA
jgi:hypothetical protein